MNPALAQAIRAARIAPPPLARPVIKLAWRTPAVIEVTTPKIDPPVVVEPSGPTLRGLLRGVAAQHGFTVEALRATGRTARVVRARQEFMFRAAAETGASINAIARMIDRHHGTVRHGIGQHCIAHGFVSPRDFDFVEEFERRRPAPRAGRVKR